MPLSYDDKEVEPLIQALYRDGFTQAGVDEIYERLGLGPAPTVPDGLLGQSVVNTRGGRRFSNGTQIAGDANSFLNTFTSQAEDPYRKYGVGNYLGLAGMLVGGAGAAGAFNPATAGAAGGSASGVGTLAGSGAPATTGGMITSSGLGAFAPGSSIGTMATSNAGLLASSGAITGGAGALGGGLLGRLANYGGTIGNNLGGLMQSPQGESVGSIPIPNIRPQTSQNMFGSAPLQPPVLPGVPQGPIQGFSRRPYQFSGQTIWM